MLDTFVGENNNLLNKNSIIEKKYNEIEYSWKNINVFPKKTKSSKVSDKSGKKILDNIFGKIKSGEALAILGGSGAGKTTLLNYLSKKSESKNLISQGETFLNNQKLNSDLLNSLSSYVMQDDILEATLSPIEILLFTAKLKINYLSEKEIETKVQDMIKKLNLENCKNTKIGNNFIRGVSGGERKRTSIGVELISDPQIVFLDEPTTGLDSYNAFDVVKNLCSLPKEYGKIVIFTIHQPSSEIFTLLDKICILADGRNIYFGPQANILNCFDSLFKLPCRENYNPFEHFMEMTTFNCIFNTIVRKSYPEIAIEEEDDDATKFEAFSEQMKRLSTIFEDNKSLFYQEEKEVFGFSDELKELVSFKQTSKGFCYEFSMLFGRNTMVSQRNTRILFFKIFQNLFTSLIQTFIYYHVILIFFKIIIVKPEFIWYK